MLSRHDRFMLHSRPFRSMPLGREPPTDTHSTALMMSQGLYMYLPDWQRLAGPLRGFRGCSRDNMASCFIQDAEHAARAMIQSLHRRRPENAHRALQIAACIRRCGCTSIDAQGFLLLAHQLKDRTVGHRSSVIWRFTMNPGSGQAAI